MANEQYLTEAHYLTCSKGAKPVRVSVDSQKSIKFSGSLAATSKDLQTKSNFICAGSVAFAAGAIAGVATFAVGACMCVPGPGWLMAAIIAAVVVAALVFAGCKCASAAATRSWLPATTSQHSKLNGAPLLTLSSQMTCPAEGGIITAQETFWEAWGTQALTNLGHIANFAFGFLVGRGGASMVAEAGTAAAGASSAGQAATTFARTFGKSFLNTAKENLVQQFTGWNQGGMFCRFMKGFGLYGQAKEHYDIWTDDEKSTWEKIKASGMSLILDVFAAKGATTVCFPAGTKVHTQWGLADIEKLEIGVPVLTYNEETGEQEYKKVKKVMRRMTRRMCAMELSNGTTLEVTPEHRFFSNGEWTPIEELNVNDTLQLKDNSIVVIENKIIFPTFVEVYNLEIEDNENYYVTEEGVLVHNGCKPRKPSDSNKNIDHSKTVVNADGSVSYTDLDGNTVLYNSNGYPDFSPYKMTQANDVAGMTGVYSHDAALANAKVGFKSTPEGYVWHHVEDGKTMQLIPQDIHQHFPHTGGASGLRNGTLP
nr:polymorphic toxin-type HINT domain-containing protein [uncultured Prevotella sp.]